MRCNRGVVYDDRDIINFYLHAMQLQAFIGDLPHRHKATKNSISAMQQCQLYGITTSVTHQRA